MDEKATETGGKPIINQTVVLVGSEKNAGTAVILAIVFGPLGMLYATVGGAICMFVVGVIVAFSSGAWWSPLLLIPINAIWARAAANWHNEELAEKAAGLAAELPDARGPSSVG